MIKLGIAMMKLEKLICEILRHLTDSNICTQKG